MNDQTIMNHIQELVREEQALMGKEDKSAEERSRLEELETKLDQYWDLLRQRRAKEEFGGNPDKAEPRDEDTVENYLQ